MKLTTGLNPYGLTYYLGIQALGTPRANPTGGADNMPAYATAKAGIVGLTRALGRGFGPDGIRVNAIEPGAVITERQKRLWFTDQASIDRVVAAQAIRRVLLGEEIARTVLFLASDDSAMITKQSITVDAGLR